MKENIVFLVGPTAAGKTGVAVRLAQKINAEVISCDSMQIYKGMDIMTSLPTFYLRKRVPHHLVNYIDPDKDYNVARYCRDATAEIKKIIKKGKTPLFVGGTGHYMTALIDGIFKGATEDKKVRSKFYRQAQKRGSQYLYQKLQRVDPKAAAKIHPNDTKRVIRALEVFEVTGRPISEFQKERKGLSSKYTVKIFCLNMERQELYKRIDKRVENMFRKGLIAEVKKLLKSKLGRTASCAIGIKELKGYFGRAYDLEETKRLMKRNSRRYAKRQLSWFRGDRRIEWVEVGRKEGALAIANRIVKLWSAHY